MIQVEKKENSILITGHALFDDYGKDIVCSAVSSIVITTINGLLKIDKSAIKFDNKDGIKIQVLKKDKITLDLIDNMMDLLNELSDKYPKNIKIKEGV